MMTQQSIGKIGDEHAQKDACMIVIHKINGGQSSTVMIA